MTITLETAIEQSARGEPLESLGDPAAASWSQASCDDAVRFVEAHPTADAYLVLLLLRVVDPPRYARLAPRTRAAILGDALGRLVFLNDWGYLDPDGCFDGPAAAALLELGADALPALLPVLEDRRDALLEGSEIATVGKLNHLRRCDFAARYVALLLGRPAELVPDTAQRDAAIAGLARDLRARLGLGSTPP